MSQRINGFSGAASVALALAALLLVLYGLTLPPPPPGADEGTPARLFQLLVVLQVPAAMAFVGTADWTEPRRSGWPLAVSGAALVVAFGALYYLENLR